MISRLMSEAFIPSVPMVTPSLMAMVLNSIGVPPAARTPSLTFAASFLRLRLQGMVSIQVFAMPMIGLLKSSSLNPTPCSMARAPALLGPLRIVSLLRGFLPSTDHPLKGNEFKLLVHAFWHERPIIPHAN